MRHTRPVLESVTWRFCPLENATQMVPLMSGQSLVELASEFEEAQGFQPSGHYAGLVLDNYRFGDLRRYLVGEQEPWPGHRVPLLGCNCGEWGCWPLVATVAAQGDQVTWTGFEQPHRKERDYSAFGPFVFDGDQYRTAVEAAATASA
jgi:hypothetical protein